MKPIIDRRNQDAVMGLGEHLEELRRRVAWSLAVLVPVFLGLFAYSQRLLELLLKPMREALLANGLPGQILATGAVETFLAATVVAGVGTLVVCSPWMVYQAWRFVAPGLYGHERRFAYILAPLSAVLSACAVAFMYFVMLPVLLAFLVAYSAGVGSDASATAAVPEGVVLPMVPALVADPAEPKPGQIWFNSTLHELRLATGGEEGKGVVVWMTAMAKPTGVVLQPRVNEWVSLFLTMALGFVGAFQMPVVVLLLGWVGVVEPRSMRRYRRYVLVACAVVGAVLTPSPDPFSMMLMTLPMYGLYELGLLLLWLLPASRVAGRKDGEEDGEPPGGPADGP